MSTVLFLGKHDRSCPESFLKRCEGPETLAGTDYFDWPVSFWIMPPVFLSIRMVAGFLDVAERKENLGCGGPIRTEFTLGTISQRSELFGVNLILATVKQWTVGRSTVEFKGMKADRSKGFANQNPVSGPGRR